eukprot:TRINITY_DN6776_c0_g1_i1.p1 TRINITY_DN6776_c0_g1~~TRINITY_DN6776_c0_g1_i1.p1  ORF type:complete len:742 (-),score=186.19 TRINITY_DN6776_c0_g1_i1:203-2428(-)
MAATATFSFGQMRLSSHAGSEDSPVEDGFEKLNFSVRNTFIVCSDPDDEEKAGSKRRTRSADDAVALGGERDLDGSCELAAPRTFTKENVAAAPEPPVPRACNNTSSAAANKSAGGARDLPVLLGHGRRPGRVDAGFAQSRVAVASGSSCTPTTAKKGGSFSAQTPCTPSTHHGGSPAAALSSIGAWSPFAGLTPMAAASPCAFFAAPLTPGAVPTEAFGDALSALSASSSSSAAAATASANATLSAQQPQPQPQAQMQAQVQDQRQREGGIAEAVNALYALAKQVDKDGPCAANTASSSTDRFELVARIRAQAEQLDSPQLFVRIAWAMGKLSIWNADAQEIVQRMCVAAPRHLKRFSSCELSNILWGLARICCSSNGGVGASSGEERCGSSVRGLILAIVAQSRSCLEHFNAQSLANSLWAVAKLDVRGHQVEAFGAECVDAIRADVLGLSPQGLANSVWAAARLRLPAKALVPLCLAVADVVCEEPDILSGFQAQELSMTLWAFAKILGRSRGAALPGSVRHFAAVVARQASSRLGEFAPQGLSNSAWALATLDLAGDEAPRAFIVDVLRLSAPQLSDFPPQAVANLCWAYAKLGDAARGRSFGIAAAADASQRSNVYGWQDISGVLSGVIQAGLSRAPEVRALAENSARWMLGNCSKIGMQALLNISLSAARIGIDAQVLDALIQDIADALAERSERLNDIDARQWKDIQRYSSTSGDKVHRRDPARRRAGGRRHRI